MKNNKMKITLIKVPYDQSEYNQGVGLAPNALISANLEKEFAQSGIDIFEIVEVNIPNKGEDSISTLTLIGKMLNQLVAQAVNNQTIPVILGGDCLNAIGATAGLQKALGKKEFGIAWADAHGDFNTPQTTLSNFLPGMSLAAISGFGLQELREEIGLEIPIDLGHIILLGTRDLDPLEKKLLETTPMSYLNPTEVADARTSVAAGYHFKDVIGFYLHIDMDVLDPNIAPAVDFPVKGGLSQQELVNAIQEITVNTPLLAISLSAINPTLDPHNKTIRSAIEILREILIS
ncbi:MAG: hypothetical protein HOF10_08905 [Chloroflexi bacterium]|nr:hypothetical protein [Chloroflexota bacterium]MBT4305208.1 hypothetical protein [Chloroflexota bacterium]MBT5335616.1 hypothetical protein [Chloroflexota bacterium]MBT6989608.1 hypothetical protein [Chloroflexota bacterium]